VTATTVVRVQLHIDVEAIVGEKAFVATQVIAPPDWNPQAAPLVWFCLPGYAMSAGYFDIRIPSIRARYSMAEYVASAGYAVVLVDHLGTGESTRITNPARLSARLLAGTHEFVRKEILQRLASATVSAALPPAPDARTLGLGHSTGARLTVHQQAQHGSHELLVLYGYSGRGRVVNQQATRSQARQLLGPCVPDAVVEVLRQLRTDGLPVAGAGGGDPTHVLTGITVPVLCAVGDADILGPPERIAHDFPNSSQTDLFVLARSGHNHNVSPNRYALWRHTVDWVRRHTSCS
jgi:pimeloyl-ACP methyl ester carboxylesterase